MDKQEMETWEIWYPQAAAAGLYFSRSQIDPQKMVLVHSAPEVLTVFVRDAEGSLKASGKDLKATQKSPMTRLHCSGRMVEREDIWPSEEDIGSLVLLSGGEAGVLKAWWHAPDYSEWRWQLELYNKK